MLLKKINKYKPYYKKFIKLKENVENRKKLLNFKKQKWEFFIKNYIKKLKRYNKFKPQNQSQYIVSKFSNKKNSYKKRYLNTLHTIKRFKLFYGGLSYTNFRKKLNKLKKTKKICKNFLKLNLQILQIFENRLDVILHRSKFCSSIRNARQLISHGKVFVNNKKISCKSFILKQGDFITINSKYHYLIEKSIKNLNIWPLPPKHLTINYKTLQIVVGNSKYTNFSTYFTFNLNLEKIINYSKFLQ